MVAYTKLLAAVVALAAGFFGSCSSSTIPAFDSRPAGGIADGKLDRRQNRFVSMGAGPKVAPPQNVTMVGSIAKVADDLTPWYAPMPTNLPRVVVYQQTHHYQEQPYSLKDLIGSGLTHIYISALHVNGNGSIHLNDHEPHNERFTTMWEECELLKANGIKVLGMVGGAAAGSFRLLTQDWETYYSNVATTIRAHGLQGIDLDVEERTSLDGITRLIRTLKQDFGPEFIVTLAPVYPAMLARNQRFSGLLARILKPSLYTEPDPITAELCKARNLHPKSKRNLSGFNYAELAATPEGKMVDWYNVQMYCGWGDPTRPGMYESIIDAGWDPERIVIGVVTDPMHGAGYRSTNELDATLRGLRSKYGNRFGGIMGWEYYRAATMPGESDETRGASWVRAVARSMGISPTAKDVFSFSSTA